MHSLRARLLAAVLAMAGAGLLLLAAITYTEQRSFLYGRLDQEAETAAPVLDDQLHAELAGQELDRAAPGAAGGAATGPGGVPYPLRAHGPDDDDDDHGAGPPPHGNVALPPGTFAQLRTPSGQALRDKFLLTYGEKTPSEPDIPKHVPIGRIFTVNSKSAAYRAFAHVSPDGLVTIAAVPAHEVQQTLSHLLLVEGLVIAGVLVLLALAASWAVRLGLSPLDRIARTASEIAAGDLSRRVSPATERTEVGRLGLALNDMLARLERAFGEKTSSEERLRRFLADASHELRTPLASIRGYAELFRMGAASDARDTELAMRRIEQESARMGTLVEDLLLLARLDRTRERPRGRVDLGRLAADAVADARAVAGEREIELDSAGPTIVAGDADQLRQVLANLTRNALVHTPAGTPIEVSLAGDDASVLLTVRDHGPGLPAEGEELFERFWRAERGRERGKAGAGLGLAITRAIVEAHGGTITACTAEDGGALFTVRLPAPGTPAAEQAPDAGARTRRPERDRPPSRTSAEPTPGAQPTAGARHTPTAAERGPAAPEHTPTAAERGPAAPEQERRPTASAAQEPLPPSGAGDSPSGATAEAAGR